MNSAMQSRTRRTWTIFAVCAVALLATLGWVSVTLFQLEKAELEARIETDFQSDLRLALWRMDAWFAPRLAREAARPFYEYESFYQHAPTTSVDLGEAQQKKGYQSITPVITASPLLTADRGVFALHFQVERDLNSLSDNTVIVTSPQVPQGDQRRIALQSLVTEEQLLQREALLEQVSRSIHAASPFTWSSTQTRVGLEGLGDGIVAQALSDDYKQMYDDAVQKAEVPSNTAEAQRARSQLRSMTEQSRRNVELNTCTVQEMAEDKTQAQWLATTKGLDPLPIQEQIEIGPLLPMWLTVDREIIPVSNDGATVSDVMPCCRLLVRRVTAEGRTFYQGVLIDWSALQAGLTEQVEDLFEEVALSSADEAGDQAAIDGRVMATLPLAVDVAGQREPLIDTETTNAIASARNIVLLAWIAALLSVGVVGMTLRASLVHGEKRSRFASAVTHELRTPLTTFRMYSEMLADGMVRDDSTRAEYLNILKSESSRLARLVENVLAYARLERSATVPATHAVELESLIEEARSNMQRRVEECAMTLEVDLGEAASTRVEADPEAFTQILFNLVENACKYAGTGTVRISARRTGSRVELKVADDGPGIPASLRDSIFAPFDRGARDPGDSTPGIGLGLALSRELARRLNGDLRCAAPDHGSHGAVFCLTLPVASG